MDQICMVINDGLCGCSLMFWKAPIIDFYGKKGRVKETTGADNKLLVDPIWKNRSK